MSSRIPYGTAVTIERLHQVERAERLLRDVGVDGDLRVRYHGDLARVEVAANVLGEWSSRDALRAIVRAVREAGFERVTIDARGFRSGSLNVLGGVVAEPLVRASTSTGVGDASGLANALRRADFECTVEERARLAVVAPASPAARTRLLAPGVRESVVDAARSHGFTHVAIEVSLTGDDATLHRD